MNTETKKFTIKLTSPMLGTVPKNKDVYKSYIAGKAKDLTDDIIDQEIETIEEVEEKGWTGFHSDENGLFLYDYMIRGFLKSATETLIANKAIKKIVAYKKWYDRLVFVSPRKIYLGVEEPDIMVERPLRVMTAQGPRVSLARSDGILEDRTFSFEIELFKNDKGITWEAICKALNYGKYVGLGQWRGSGGYGQFVIE
jgi:hypothetical protein